MRYIAVDTETGGLDAKVHGLTEVSLVAFDIDPKDPLNYRIVETRKLKVEINDQLAYTPIALEMQRRSITDDEDALDEKTVRNEILAFLKKNVGGSLAFFDQSQMLAHFADFDYKFIQQLWIRLGYPKSTFSDDRCSWTCTRNLFRFMRSAGMHTCSSESLKNIVAHYGLEWGEKHPAHSSMGDALMTVEVFARMLADMNAFFGK